jgi:hypothetical protein
MKLHISAAFLIVLIAESGFAQDAEKPAPSQTNQPQTNQTQTPPINMKGKLGLYIYSNTDFSQGNSIGGSIGAKYFILSRLAVRGGVTINNSGSGFERPRFDEFNNGQNINDSFEGDRRGTGLTTLGANAYAMYYPLNSGKFSFYAGAGGLYHFYSTHSSIIVNGVRINNQQQNLFGVGGLIGTEYNLYKKVNLILEYNPTYLFGGRQNENNELPGTNIRIPHQRNFNAGNFNLGAVYYFN